MKTCQRNCTSLCIEVSRMLERLATASLRLGWKHIVDRSCWELTAKMDLSSAEDLQGSEIQREVQTARGFFCWVLAENHLPKPEVIQLLGTMTKSLSTVWGVSGTAQVHWTLSSKLMKMFKRSDVSVCPHRGQVFPSLTENAFRTTSFFAKH